MTLSNRHLLIPQTFKKQACSSNLI